ncbi:MAG TPA: exodeoxyribonuclease VII small subunit [Phycisphaerae bacterium]|nr:exodeoxyribonuclease VII small subunit [Phycisphaerae bacterium]HRY66739.1 exodeoxyribonuclease VII small subunit [Phycisphaerae bacterium]HSA29011.1 exodeoxyribonuclease VII small subunit [Phycisphaerae bacterium]
MPSPSSKQPSFEDALNQLEAIVSAIEEGKIGLQNSITEYEKGMKLIRHCRAILAEAEARIQQLQVTEDGRVSTGPFESPSTD